METVTASKIRRKIKWLLSKLKQGKTIKITRYSKIVGYITPEPSILA